MCYHVINIISSVSEPLPGYCSVNLTDTTKYHQLEASADMTYSITWDWHSHLALKVLFAVSSITNCLNKSKTHAKLVVIIREATCTCRSSLDLPVAMSVVVKTSFFAKLCRQNIHSTLLHWNFYWALTNQNFAASDTCILSQPRNLMVDTRPTLEGVVEWQDLLICYLSFTF